MSIKYNPEFIQLISELSQVNKKIIIEKDEINQKVKVSRKNEEKYMAYILEAPYDCFDIPEKIGIYDYPDFFRCFKIITNPKLAKVENKLAMVSADGSQFNYILANPETLKTGAKKVNYTNPGYEFKLTRDMLAEINQAQNQVKPRYALFNCTNDGVTMDLFSLKENQESSFRKKFETNILDGADPDGCEFKIYADVFEKIPKRDYVVTIQAPGHVRISLVDDVMDLNIYTGRTK